MKLWLLRPNKNLNHDDDPWEPWYDKCFGFVIRAEHESIARKIASYHGGDENDSYVIGDHEVINRKAWLDPKYSSCIELSVDGPAEIIINDFRSA